MASKPSEANFAFVKNSPSFDNIIVSLYWAINDTNLCQFPPRLYGLTTPRKRRKGTSSCLYMQKCKMAATFEAWIANKFKVEDFGPKWSKVIVTIFWRVNLEGSKFGFASDIRF